MLTLPYNTAILSLSLYIFVSYIHQVSRCISADNFPIFNLPLSHWLESGSLRIFFPSSSTWWSHTRRACLALPRSHLMDLPDLARLRVDTATDKVFHAQVALGLDVWFGKHTEYLLTLIFHSFGRCPATYFSNSNVSAATKNSRYYTWTSLKDTRTAHHLPFTSKIDRVSTPDGSASFSCMVTPEPIATCWARLDKTSNLKSMTNILIYNDQ